MVKPPFKHQHQRDRRRREERRPPPALQRRQPERGEKPGAHRARRRRAAHQQAVKNQVPVHVFSPPHPTAAVRVRLAEITGRKVALTTRPKDPLVEHRHRDTWL